jgi:hypothetical protein
MHILLMALYRCDKIEFMEWEVQYNPAFAEESRSFARPAQIEIAVLSGLLQRFGHIFDALGAIR